MLRSHPWRATSFALTTLFGCGREDRSRATTIDVACIDAECGGANPRSAARDASGRDASHTDASPRANDGSTPRGGLDGAIPPFGDGGSLDAATLALDASLGADGGTFVDIADGETVCTAGLARSVAFRTDLLEPIEAVAGSRLPGASAALVRAWRSALARTGLPGPALLVLTDMGPAARGATRALRVGTPAPSIALDAGEAFAFARDESDGGRVAAPILAGAYVVQGATHVRASLFGATPFALRFLDAEGAPRDVPVLGVALHAVLRSDPSGRCTALDVVDLALGIASSHLDATLDGIPLTELLPASGPASSLAVVHLAGPAPALTFLEGAP